ncbi:MAG: protein kinase [Muribaculaceae bacterium]|nr:protein kinase [Muribaculaceae bacterium]
MPHGLNKGAALKNGTYRIEKVLGQGSFGITYLATAKFTTQGNLGKIDVEAKVAIKEFFMSEVNGRHEDGSTVEGSTGSVFSNYRKKFKKEAENLSKLEHPNIVKVFDVFDENNTTYYVMEFLEGQNLDDYINDSGFIEEEEAIKIIAEIGVALAYMHSKNMLHLDIKPKNIMRKSDGKDYLIDFGLSKQFTDDGEPESSTSIGLGTPGYAPIEQAGYKQDGSFPATLDVYALGATLFKILTGKRPPESTYILNEGFPEKELSSKGISKNTQTVLTKAMAPIKRQRYQTINSFIKGFEAEETIVDHLPKHKPIPQPIPSIEPVPKPHQIQTPKPKRNYKWIWYVVFLALILIGYFWWDNYTNRSQTVSPAVEIDSIAIVEVEEPDIPVVPQIVTDMEWNSPLGKAIYTGRIETINGSKIPHGKGVARIVGGKYAGNTYDGYFEKGVMQGQSTYTNDNNGDTFVGTFLNNQYHKGRYTIKSSGKYFEGTFKNEQPFNGYWYNNNSSLKN